MNAPLAPADETEAAIAAERARAGGKAAGLLRLRRAGVDVPPFVAVDAALVESWAEAARLDDLAPTLAPGPAAVPPADPAAPEERAHERAHERLLATPPPPALVSALRDAVSALPPGPLAVRSSALDEDSSLRSHAGQLESVLFVEGEPALLRAVARCLASSLSSRASTYRAALAGPGEDTARPRLGVIVQQMVEGQTSGVAFTADPAADPTSGARGTVVIAAAPGLCEGVVQGTVAADTFHVDKITRAVREDLADKREKVVRAAGSGTALVPLEAAEQQRPALDRPALLELVAALVRLEESLGFPLDVEWTRAGERFVLLQVRPITTVPADGARAGAGERELVWDNANIVESFSGPTTALTFSYIRYAYSVAYQQSCEVGGVSADEVKENLRTFQSMLGFHDGRVYYNLASWYGLLALFPGFEKNKAHMERMMGVRESAKILARAPVRTPRQRLRMGLAFVKNLWRIDALVADFESRLAATLAEWPASRFGTMSLTELSDAYHALVWRLLWHWQAPLVTDFAAMMSFGILTDLTKKWDLDATGALANDLLGGEGDVASLEPTRSLLRLADLARSTPAVRELLEQTADAGCFEALQAARALGPGQAAFVTALEEHLGRWGDRCIGELKLEEPSLQERPDFLFAMLRNYLRRDDVSADSLERGERERRRAAEEKARRGLRAPWRRGVFFWVLAQARKHMKNRESMRFGRTRTFALLRRLVLRAGEILASHGRLDERDDVFHLTIDELLGFIDGTGVTGDLGAVARARRAEHRLHLAMPDPPDRFVTRGAVRLVPREARADAVTGGLRGTPCSPGRVRAKVRVIDDPRAALAAKDSAHGAWRLDGEILVAARTDPGWVPLYPSASGLLVERGSPLSHSAIVARELGLPTIVNIPNLLATVKDGMVVEMDGATGTVVVVTE